MFERLQKPFLTVETGEAYQPIRIVYELSEKEELKKILNSLRCCEKSGNGSSWNWFWRDECDEIAFESLDTFQRDPQQPIRLGTLSIRDDTLQMNFPSFKRACLAVPFFHKHFPASARLVEADFINKVFGTDERLPHGFSELLKDDELDEIVHQRQIEYDKIQRECENAKTAEEAFKILADYTEAETKKRLPYAERYVFEFAEGQDPEITFLSFYIFLRGRELVAIRRWYGSANYSLSDVSQEVVEKVFGHMDIDLID